MNIIGLLHFMSTISIHCTTLLDWNTELNELLSTVDKFLCLHKPTLTGRCKVHG